ncbi:MAG: hypothetical protein HOV81_21360 [Kofleriaceae bacterium]|nr:hypothetical protein [Kofleriaceae bacterium]
MDEDLRLAIYDAFARTGAPPPLARLVEIAGDATTLARTLEALAAARHLALDPDGSIALAHPFASRSFGFSVMSSTTLWWGGCAWDSFAIPHLVESASDVLVATRCPACDRPLAWVVGRTAPPEGPEVAHFLVPVREMWNDVIHACSNQRLFCDSACIDRYLAANRLVEGTRLSLPELWRLASRWYEGRLARGYQRRAPAQAEAYFRSCGLDGPFWQARILSAPSSVPST